MTGGGLRVLVPGMSNADAIAWAIVGAARAYGDDPIAALTAPKVTGNEGRKGRAVVAAIAALATKHGDLKPLCRLFDRSPAAVNWPRRHKPTGFDAAVAGARSLIDFAAEALAEDDLEPEPDAEPVFTPPPASAGVRLMPAPPPEPASVPAPPLQSLRARIMEALRAAPRNTLNLATMLDAKEAVIGQTLSQMRHEKIVRSDASAGLGRAMLWSLTEAWSDA